MSLYANYIKELSGKDIIETDKGYATYSIVNDGIWIEDIFVSEAFRKENVASQMADQIVEIAKEKGFQKIFGSVTPNANNSTASLRVLLAYGFKLSSSINNFIWLEKAI